MLSVAGKSMREDVWALRPSRATSARGVAVAGGIAEPASDLAAVPGIVPSRAAPRTAAAAAASATDDADADAIQAFIAIRVSIRSSTARC